MRPDPGKLARAAVLAAGMAALAVGALASGSPSVSGLSAYVVTPGSALGIDGQGFTQFGTSDCTVGQAPSVTFYHLPDLAQTQVAPKSLNAPDCTDTHINLTVPGNLADGAQVGVAAFDNIGSSHQTGHNLQVTILPTISGISPASGQLGTNSVTVSGANLRPPTMPQNPQLTLACGTLGSWTGSSVSFNPDNQSCNQSLRFNVLKDASSQASTQQISLAAGAYTFLPPTVNGGNLGSATVGKTIAIAGQYLGPSAGQVTFGGGVTNPASSW
ncbi:MAG TPA: hypothetical protein VG245_07825, partial [Candidatus Dormibacteraeota bacterium]|nr:hypothetical protein [Candidatus Dormibacteraeota bacterium]